MPTTVPTTVPKTAPKTAPTRRGWLAALASGAATLAAAGLPGCSSLGLPREITLDEAELQRRLAQAFPMQRRLLEVVDLQLVLPQLQLLPEQDRLSVTLGLRSEDRLWQRALHGRLGFDAGLRFEPSDASLRLTQVRVHTLVLDQPAEAAAPGRAALSGLPARLARVVAEQLLEGLSLYQLTPARQAELRQAGLRPGAVRVTRQGIAVTLQAAP